MSDIEKIKYKASLSLLTSMAKVKDVNVPLNLQRLITTPTAVTDPWFSESDFWGNSKWVKLVNVFGVHFFFLFKAPYISKSRGELTKEEADTAAFEFCGLSVFFPQSGKMYTREVSASTLAVMMDMTERVTQTMSEDDIVSLFGVTETPIRNPLNHIVASVMNPANVSNPVVMPMGKKKEPVKVPDILD